MPGSPGPQGPLFTSDQLTQIAQIFRMGIELVVREMSARLDSLQAQVTRVQRELQPCTVRDRLMHPCLQV